MSQGGQKMNYCKEAKVGISIKGQKMVILVYIMRLQAKHQLTVVNLCFSNGPITPYITEWTIDDDFGLDHSMWDTSLNPIN
jgi:hypothetical protein